MSQRNKPSCVVARYCAALPPAVACFSKTCTRQPARAKKIAADKPPIPAPTTRTSGELLAFLMNSKKLRKKIRSRAHAIRETFYRKLSAEWVELVSQHFLS